MQLMADERSRRAWNSSWWAYNELNPSWYEYPSENIIESEARRIPRAVYDNGGSLYSPLGPNEWINPTGYVAPPLYGAWANAPYFHNGSVPNLWGVLKPADRPKVWKRTYTAAGLGGKNKGYDYSYSAFDFQKLGWKHTALNCSDSILTNPFLPCSQNMATIDVLFSVWDNVAAQKLNLAYQTPPPITDRQIASRMIFNSYLYGNGNGGHDFTQSLTDAERWALIEYLKTL
jgi:hypothetical protein